MGGTADIDWVGPLGPLVNRLGEMSNYRVKFLGMPPAIPIVVSPLRLGKPLLLSFYKMPASRQDSMLKF